MFAILSIVDYGLEIGIPLKSYGRLESPIYWEVIIVYKRSEINWTNHNVKSKGFKWDCECRYFN